MTVYRFGKNPDDEFQHGRLQGFTKAGLTRTEMNSERAQKLYAELLTDPEELNSILGKLPDGRLALVGLTLPEEKFAVEKKPDA